MARSVRRGVEALCLVACIALQLPACASLRGASGSEGPRRPFDWERDIFAYPNELFWNYDIDQQTGRQEGHARAEPVDFGQRCMVMSRGVRQFHRSARFEPDLPRASDAEYRRFVRTIFRSDPREEEPRRSVIIPGYSDLHSFSRERAALVKSETPGGWRAYIQRGNWRMLFPFSPRQQRQTAEELLLALERRQLPVVRLVRFPRITINHAVLIFAAEQTPTEIRFRAYDPNHIEAPLSLVFDRAAAAFEMPPRNYFAGGSVSVYQAYHGPWF